LPVATAPGSDCQSVRDSSLVNGQCALVNEMPPLRSDSGINDQGSRFNGVPLIERSNSFAGFALMFPIR
jgi:hypothetical protein